MLVACCAQICIKSVIKTMGGPHQWTRLPLIFITISMRESILDAMIIGRAIAAGESPCKRHQFKSLCSNESCSFNLEFLVEINHRNLKKNNNMGRFGDRLHRVLRFACCATLWSLSHLLFKSCQQIQCDSWVAADETTDNHSPTWPLLLWYESWVEQVSSIALDSYLTHWAVNSKIWMHDALTIVKGFWEILVPEDMCWNEGETCQTK